MSHNHHKETVLRQFVSSTRSYYISYLHKIIYLYYSVLQTIYVTYCLSYTKRTTKIIDYIIQILLHSHSMSILLPHWQKGHNTM